VLKAAHTGGVRIASAVSMPGAYRSLDAWRFADDLFLEIHKVTKTFPLDERFVLTSQLRRGALSVPTNVVEGTARFHPKERLQFLRTAWASLAEVEYLLTVAQRLSYVSGARLVPLNRLIGKAAAALRGLIASVERTTRESATGKENA
jgi:four helix bundle protein